MVVLVAFGKRGYGLMAHNLAFSIKHHNHNIKIGLWIDEALSKQLPDRSLFDDIRILEEKDYRDKKGKIDPAKAKTQLYRFGTAMAEKFLYLDVDGLCLSDIQPLLDSLDGLQIATEVMSTGGRNDEIQYSPWASNENIWKLFDLNEDAKFCGIQSSWAYFEKCEIGDRMQAWLDYYMEVGVPTWMLTQTWGGTLPDELLYQGVYAKLGIVPSYDGKVVFFGNSRAKETEQEVKENYKVLSLYGNGGNTTRTLTVAKWLKLNDTLLKQYGANPVYKARELMNDKHLTSRN